MSAYSLGAYTHDKKRLASSLDLDEKDIVYFNSVASIGIPACFLAVNHKSKEYHFMILFKLELLLVFVEQLLILK